MRATLSHFCCLGVVLLSASRTPCRADEIRLLFTVQGTSTNPSFLEVLDPVWDSPAAGELASGPDLPLRIRPKPRRFDSDTIRTHLRRVFEQFGTGTPVFFRIAYDRPTMMLRSALEASARCGAKNAFVLIDFEGGAPPYRCTRLRLEDRVLNAAK